MSDKKWKQASGGTFHKWDTPGTFIEGVYRGTHAGKFGDVGTLDTPSGPIMFGIKAALVFMLRPNLIGQEIRLVYNGPKVNQNTGKEFKDFTLFVADNGDNADPDLPF